MLLASGPLASLLTSAPAAAQTVVGHTPETSPFRDVTPSQHITLLGGYYRAQKDEIGATPRGGALFGLRYDLPVGGPADFFIRAERVSSHRTAFDPTLPAATSAIGDQSFPLYLTDLGFAFNLTGQKSWHSMIPVIGLGIGVASASPPSAGGKDPYRFGTQFAFRTDAGIRIVPGGTYELRLMASNVLYQNHYPNAYYVPPAGTTIPLLAASTAKSGYRSNLALTAGLAIPIFR